jgi:hypothetical protein
MPSGRHEAPWGARHLYTGGGAGTSLTGPGMKVSKKRKLADAPRAKLGSIEVEAERAALEGMTVAQYRARSRPHRPASTRVKSSAAAGSRSLAASSASDSDASGSDSGGWFYVDKSGGVQGPFGEERIKEWAACGALTQEVHVRPWHVVEFKELSEYTSSGGPLAPTSDGVALAEAGADPLNVGPASGDTAASTWVKLTEGHPPNLRHVLFNALTGEKRPIKPRPPSALPAPTSTAPAAEAAAAAALAGRSKAGAGALQGLSGYGSSDSDD